MISLVLNGSLSKNMKYLIKVSFIGLICLILSPSLYAQTNSRHVGSIHSFSISTPYRLEYSYEHVWNSGMSLIGRIGGGSEVYSPDSKNYALGNGFRLTIEPRYYLNDEDFFSLKASGAIIIPNTPCDVSLVPVYGIKRNFTKHWFCEFTVGGGIGYYSSNGGRFYFEPHLQFRLGFKL